MSFFITQTAIRVDDAPAGRFSWLTRNYQPRSVPPINLANTSRIGALVRNGNLYLTSRDVVALALENNIDIEVQRYGPLLAREVLRRAQGGGALRSVGSGAAAGPTRPSDRCQCEHERRAGSMADPRVSLGGIVTQLGLSVPCCSIHHFGLVDFVSHTTARATRSSSVPLRWLRAPRPCRRLSRRLSRSA